MFAKQQTLGCVQLK